MEKPITEPIVANDSPLTGETPQNSQCSEQETLTTQTTTSTITTIAPADNEKPNAHTATHSANHNVPSESGKGELQPKGGAPINQQTYDIYTDLDANKPPVLDESAPHVALRIATWNCQGIKDNFKANAILEKGNMVYDVIMLQEIHSPKDWGRIGKYEQDGTHMFLSKGTTCKAGVAIYFNTRTEGLAPDPTSLRRDNQGRVISIEATWFDHRYNFICIYGPTENDKARSSFFESLYNSEHYKQNMINIMGGDFNVVLDTNKDLLNYAGKYQSLHTESMGSLTELVQHMRMTDSWTQYVELYPIVERELFTWQRKIKEERGGGFQKARLDRLYISEKHAEEILYAGTDETIHSDHKPFVIHLASPSGYRRYPKPWRFNNQHLKNRIFTEAVRSIIKRFEEAIRQAKDDPLKVLELSEELKIGIKRRSKRLGRARASIKRKLKRRLNQRYIRLTYRLGQQLEPATRKGLELELEKVITELEALAKEADDAARIYAHLQFADSAEMPTPLFLRLVDWRRAKSRIAAVTMEDGTISSVQNDISDTFVQFYQKLFNKKETTSEARDCLLSTITRGVPKTLAEEASKPFEEKEIIEIIKELGKCKAVGSDGLSAEFYQHFGKEMAPVLLLVIEAIIVAKEMPEKSRESIVCLLPKKGDLSLPKNWRPISLLNTDYKIITKLLVSRFNIFLPTIIATDQYGFVPGRQMEDAIILCQSIIHHLQQTEQSGYLVMLDQEKAFDRVDPEYLLSVLRKYSVPELLVGIVDTIYRKTPTQLSINGEITESFSLLSGVRQGCPLSPLLFLLSIEPLANLVRGHPQYKGIRLPDGTRLSVTMFADDSNFYAADQNDIQIVKHLTTLYSQGSGAKANIEKTEILPIGKRLEKYQEEISGIKVLPYDQSVRLLGIQVGNKVDSDKALEPVTTRIKGIINKCRGYKSLKGKLVIIQTLILPIIMFHTPFIRVTKKTGDTFNKLLADFVWSEGKKHKVSTERLQAPHAAGGIELPDIKLLSKASRIRWTSKLLDTTSELSWRELAIAQICQLTRNGLGLDLLMKPDAKMVAKRNHTNHFWVDNIDALRRLEAKLITFEPSEQPIIAMEAAMDEIAALPIDEHPIKLANILADMKVYNMGGAKTQGATQASKTGCYIKRKDIKRIENRKTLPKPDSSINSASKTFPRLALMPEQLEFEAPTAEATEGDEDKEAEEKTLQHADITTNSATQTNQRAPSKSAKPKETKRRKKDTQEPASTCQPKKGSNGRVGKNKSREATRIESLDILKWQLTLDGQPSTMAKYKRSLAYKTLTHTKYGQRHPGFDRWNVKPEEEHLWHFMSKCPHPLLKRKIYDIRYVLALRNHMIGRRLRHTPFGKNMDLSCSLCGQECTDGHLFIDCTVINSFWEQVETQWKEATRNNRAVPIEHVKFDKATKLFGPNVDKFRAGKTTEYRDTLATNTIFDLFIGTAQLAIWDTYWNHITNNNNTNTTTRSCYKLDNIVDRFNGSMLGATINMLHICRLNDHVPKKYGIKKVAKNLTKELLGQINFNNWPSVLANLVRTGKQASPNSHNKISKLEPKTPQEHHRSIRLDRKPPDAVPSTVPCSKRAKTTITQDPSQENDHPLPKGKTDTLDEKANRIIMMIGQMKKGKKR